MANTQGAQVSEHRKVDVTITNHGTIFLFQLHSDAAREWWEANCPDGESWAGAQVVEHRFARDIAQGLLDDGLEVE